MNVILCRRHAPCPFWLLAACCTAERLHHTSRPDLEHSQVLAHHTSAQRSQPRLLQQQSSSNPGPYSVSSTPCISLPQPRSSYCVEKRWAGVLESIWRTLPKACIFSCKPCRPIRNNPYTTSHLPSQSQKPTQSATSRKREICDAQGWPCPDQQSFLHRSASLPSTAILWHTLVLHDCRSVGQTAAWVDAVQCPRGKSTSQCFSLVSPRQLAAAHRFETLLALLKL